MFYDQGGYGVRFEWGLAGVERLAPECDAVVIVDVLSFSTSVEIAVSRGASVYPYRWRSDDVYAFAERVGGIAAAPRRSPDGGYTLSPASLLRIEPGTRLVLPSPNGAALSLQTGDKPTFAGCLRNASAVAGAAAKAGDRVLVIAAGERWPDGSLRPALEDLVGAGAIIEKLPVALSRSPEAEVARAAFLAVHTRLHRTLEECSSGRELIERGFSDDVRLAAQYDCSHTAPRLVSGAYVSGSDEGPYAIERGKR